MDNIPHKLVFLLYFTTHHITAFHDNRSRVRERSRESPISKDSRRQPSTMTTQPPKRTRIDPTAILPTTTNGTAKKASTAPLALAQSFIKSHISSLHPEIGSVMETHGQAFVLSMSKLHNKQRQLTKMETDEDFFPRSARFEFKLHPSKAVEQVSSYTDLQEEIDTSINDMKRLFKAYIIRLLKIENEQSAKQLLIDTASSLRQVIDAFKVGHENSPSADIIAATIIEQHHETILKTIPGATLQQFKTEYVKLHSLNTWPNAHIDPQANGSRQSASQSPFFSQTRTTTPPTPAPTPTSPTTTLCQTIYTAFRAVFITSWDSYKEQIRKNEITLQIKRLKVNRELEKSAEDTAIAIDDDGTAPPELIAEMVAKKTNEATKPFRKEIADLSNQVKQLLMLAKNDRRGRGGANQTNTPSTKKTVRRTSKDSAINSPKHRGRSRSPNVQRKGKRKGNTKPSGGGNNNATPRKSRKSPQRGGRRQSRRK